jgi:hypothetical protein
LHANEKPALMTLTPRPFLHEVVELLPSAQIEISNAKVSPIRQFHRLLQRRKKRRVNIIEYARHRGKTESLGGAQSRPRNERPRKWLGERAHFKPCSDDSIGSSLARILALNSAPDPSAT